MFFVAFLLMSIGLSAQTTTASGVVTTEEGGELVAGASVLVVGTSLGGITDVDGKFSIMNIPSSYKTLIIF